MFLVKIKFRKYLVFNLIIVMFINYLSEDVKLLEVYDIENDVIGKGEKSIRKVGGAEKRRCAKGGGREKYKEEKGKRKRKERR